MSVKCRASAYVSVVQFLLLFLVAATAIAQVSPLERGEKLFMNNEMEAARPFLETALQQDPSDERLYLYLSTVYENTGNNQRAIEVLQQGVRYASEYLPIIYYNIGNNLYKENMNELAFEMYSKALGVDPAMSDGYLNRANTALRLENFENAIGDYGIYLRLQPNSAQRASIEEVLTIISAIVQAQRQKAVEEERLIRLEEERKRALLDQVRSSLQNASQDTTNLSTQTEDVERVHENADIVD